MFQTPACSTLSGTSRLGEVEARSRKGDRRRAMSSTLEQQAAAAGAARPGRRSAAAKAPAAAGGGGADPGEGLALDGSGALGALLPLHTAFQLLVAPSLSHGVGLRLKREITVTGLPLAPS